MPAPLEMPVKVIRLPAIITERDAALGCVSVVMMASAACNQLSVCRLAIAAGKPAINFSTGSGSKITPVEKGKICCASQPSNLAKASHVACALANPASPVPALALPVLMTKARIGLVPARCIFATCTGAAQKRFVVNTPATVAPSAKRMTSTSLRPGFLIPACA